MENHDMGVRPQAWIVERGRVHPIRDVPFDVVMSQMDQSNQTTIEVFFEGVSRNEEPAVWIVP
jgi:hypothetical protein